MSSESVVGTRQSASLGIWSLVFGIAALVGAIMIGQASYDWVASFDPPGWLRILSGWMIPVGAIVAIGLGVRSISRRSGRNLAFGGIALAVLAIGMITVMIVTTPY